MTFWQFVDNNVGYVALWIVTSQIWLLLLWNIYWSRND